MCCLLPQLLMDSVDVLSSEECTSKTKLCRRLAKLEAEKMSPLDSRNEYTRLCEAIRPRCQDSIDYANTISETEWNSYKSDIKREVPPLPIRASKEDLVLKLPNSSSYLQGISKHSRSHSARSGVHTADIDLDVFLSTWDSLMI